MMKKRKKVLITLLVFMLLFSSILPVTPLQAEEVTTEEIVEPEVTQEPEITPEPEVTPEPVVPPVTVAKPKSVKLSKTSLTYTGKRIVPTVKAVYDREGKVIASSHYKVIFPSRSTSVGTYKIRVVFNGKVYSGELSKTYKIIPRKTYFKHITPRVNGFQVTWKTRDKYTHGYQIQYSTRADFSEKVTKTYTGAEKSRAIVKSLPGHKRYYVRVRTYYKKDGVKYNSLWSTVKELKTRTYSDNYKSLNSIEATSGFQYFGTEKKLKTENRRSLNQAIRSITNSGCRVSFIMMDLDTGEGIAYYPDRVHYSASTIKGPYVCAISLYAPTKAKKYRSYITPTITMSDNNCYNYLRRQFGSDPIIKYMKAAHTTISSKTWVNLTPKKLSCLWVKNWEFFNSGKTNATWTKGIFNRSYQSFINEKLKNSKTEVYSKPGWIGGSGKYRCQHDAGIVHKSNGHTYLVTVLSDAYGKKSQLRQLVAQLDKCEEDLLKK